MLKYLEIIALINKMENPNPETPKDPKKMSLDEMQALYIKDPATYQAMFNK